MVRAEMCHTHQIDFPIRNNPLFIHQPRAARACEAFENALERRIAPIIVVPWNAIQGNPDARQNFQRLRQKLRLFDQVAGEKDELRRQRIDLIHDRLGVRAIALVMQVAELDKSMRGLIREPKMRRLHPFRFDPTRVTDHRKRREDTGGADKFAAAELPWF